MNPSALPEPPVPAGEDLHGFAFTPWYRARFFGSAFQARANDAEWRAGVTLSLKAWDQMPAGSLPDDDIELCRLAELGRDVRTWRKVKPMALHGWYRASDGRLYNDVVAELVISALQKKRGQTDRTAKARQAAIARRLAAQTGAHAPVTPAQADQQQTLLQADLPIVTDPVTASVTESNGIEEKGIEKKGQGNLLPSSGADGDSPRNQVFRDGKLFLANAGMSATAAGSFLGGLCKTYGDAAVLQVLGEAQVEQPVEPKSWMTAACEARKGADRRRGNGVAIGHQDYDAGFGRAS